LLLLCDIRLSLITGVDQKLKIPPPDTVAEFPTMSQFEIFGAGLP
jgi:hypothetical protein